MIETEAVEKIRAFFKDPKSKDTRVRLIAAAGIIAMLLLLLSDCAGGCEKKEVSAGASVSNDSYDAYSRQLEERLEAIVSSIDGAGKTEIMVTLQNGVRYIYASADKTSIDTSEKGEESRESRENTENSYIIMETDNGEEALVCTQLMPSVEGVVIVCEGAGDPQVAEQIRAAVTTALGISPNRVCIALMKE